MLGQICLYLVDVHRGTCRVRMCIAEAEYNYVLGEEEGAPPRLSGAEALHTHKLLAEHPYRIEYIHKIVIKRICNAKMSM